MTDLATTLREWRGAVSQARAASALGVSLKTYQGWEQGRIPDASTLGLLLRLIALMKPG